MKHHETQTISALERCGQIAAQAVLWQDRFAPTEEAWTPAYMAGKGVITLCNRALHGPALKEFGDWTIAPDRVDIRREQTFSERYKRIKEYLIWQPVLLVSQDLYETGFWSVDFFTAEESVFDDRAVCERFQADSKDAYLRESGMEGVCNGA